MPIVGKQNDNHHEYARQSQISETLFQGYHQMLYRIIPRNPIAGNRLKAGNPDRMRSSRRGSEAIFNRMVLIQADIPIVLKYPANNTCCPATSTALRATTISALRASARANDSPIDSSFQVPMCQNVRSAASLSEFGLSRFTSVSSCYTHPPRPAC